MDHGQCCHVAAAEAVAGVLQKWTNYGKGWRWRWFMLRSGVISYAKTHSTLAADPNLRLIGDLSAAASHSHTTLAADPNLRLIGDLSAAASHSHSRRRHHNTLSIVHLKISSFRESKSDERRFYISTARKTLQLRSGSKGEREAWVQALLSTKISFPLRRSVSDGGLCSSSASNTLSVSTARLRKRLLEEGLSEAAVKECEQIMLAEFSHLQSIPSFFRTQFQASNIDAEASGIRGFSSIGRGKYSECSTTESSEDIEKRDEAWEEDETAFYDTRECFSVNATMESERRKKLPEPAEKEKGVSLWSMIKDNVGKDLTRVCLPVYFNEPISSLQKCCEDMEYSYLLDRAYEFGKAGKSLERAMNVAAFAVSAYASSEGRHCKPFNPLLGETYEADFPDKGIRFFSEKVSHHPTLIACHCEGRGWKFWAESNIRTKFWGRSIQLDPVGDLSLEFDDGEVFQWNKVTTTIYNLILGKVYCDHHGLMHIRGNRQYSCKLKFKEQSLLDRNPRQVIGCVEDASGKKEASVFGKWDESMFSSLSGDTESRLLWKRTKAPHNLTRYNLTSFAITLNELTPELQEKLPPTDSRLRPDQRHLENGEYDKANAEKQRLEKRQRMSRKLQESGWKPRWFGRDGEEGAFRFAGGYWEARDRGIWDDCPDIFGDFDEDHIPLQS